MSVGILEVLLDEALDEEELPSGHDELAAVLVMSVGILDELLEEAPDEEELSIRTDGLAAVLPDNRRLFVAGSKLPATTSVFVPRSRFLEWYEASHSCGGHSKTSGGNTFGPSTRLYMCTMLRKAASAQ